MVAIKVRVWGLRLVHRNRSLFSEWWLMFGGSKVQAEDWRNKTVQFKTSTNEEGSAATLFLMCVTGGTTSIYKVVGLHSIFFISPFSDHTAKYHVNCQLIKIQPTPIYDDEMTTRNMTLLINKILAQCFGGKSWINSKAEKLHRTATICALASSALLPNTLSNQNGRTSDSRQFSSCTR